MSYKWSSNSVAWTTSAPPRAGRRSRETARRSSATVRRSFDRSIDVSSRVVALASPRACRAASTTLANFHGPRRLFTRLRTIPTPFTPRALHPDPLPANAAPITLSVRAVKPGVATGTGMPALVVVASRPRPRLAREEDDADDDERRHRTVSRHPARVPSRSSRRRTRRRRRRRRRRHRVVHATIDARPRRRIDRPVTPTVVIVDVIVPVRPRGLHHGFDEPARRRRHPPPSSLESSPPRVVVSSSRARPEPLTNPNPTAHRAGGPYDRDGSRLVIRCSRMYKQ